MCFVCVEVNHFDRSIVCGEGILILNVGGQFRGEKGSDTDFNLVQRQMLLAIDLDLDFSILKWFNLDM